MPSPRKNKKPKMKIHPRELVSWENLSENESIASLDDTHAAMKVYAKYVEEITKPNKTFVHTSMAIFANDIQASLMVDMYRDLHSEIKQLKLDLKNEKNRKYVSYVIKNS